MNWTVTIGPVAKATLNTDLGALTTASLVFTDVQAPNLSDSTLEGQVAAVITAGQAALAALIGPAPNAQCRIRGTIEPNTVAGSLPAARGSSIQIEIFERFV